MPGFNLTVQQYTPLIRYAPSSAWRPGTPADSQFFKYNDGFRLTTANESTATFDFNGTGVWIYGAYRPNHGNFSVALDGIPQGAFNGAADDQFQVVLFGAGGLENRKHSIELTNIPLSANNPYVDIDFIIYEMQLDGKSRANPVQVDVSAGNWTHDDLWSLETDSTQGALLTSTTLGAKTTLTFQGETVEVYGSTGPLNSRFDLSVDGGAITTLDSYYDESRPSVLLWSANSLGDVPHKLEITNQPNSTSQNKLVLNYAVVRSATNQKTSNGANAPSTTASAAPSISNRPTESAAFNSNTGAIIGAVIAGVVILVVVAAAAFHWQRKQRLLERPTSSYVPPMSSNRDILPTTNPSAGSGLQGSHPKFGAPVQTNAANNPVSSNNSGLLSTPSNVTPPLPVSSYSGASHQPREQFAQPLSYLPATSEPRTQPFPPAQSHPPTEPEMRSSYAYQPHPQSIFGDWDDTPGRSAHQGRVTSPPPDYWSSAGQATR